MKCKTLPMPYLKETIHIFRNLKYLDEIVKIMRNSPLVMEILQKLKDINILTSACATIKKIQIKIAMLIFFSLAFPSQKSTRSKFSCLTLF